MKFALRFSFNFFPMLEPINQIRERIQPLRQLIIHHPTYQSIQTIDDLRIFMEFHVYAVWDFMSLLKSLQIQLTCTSVPWFPVGDAQTRHLINEIVAGEESDIDPDGNYKSHFELYLSAMEQAGADVSGVTSFMSALRAGLSLDEAFDAAHATAEVRSFVRFTFDVINSGRPEVQAAVFTFGREDLIPGMFLSIVEDLDRRFPNQIGLFKYYLERHIEVDGDHHSGLAIQMTQNLCGSDSNIWTTVAALVEASLAQRNLLWDGVHRTLKAKDVAAVSQ